MKGFARGLVLKQKHKVNSKMAYSLLYQDNDRPKLTMYFFLNILINFIILFQLILI